MPTQISGSTGVSKVQDGVVVTADIADLAITPEKMSQKMTLMQSVDVTTLSDKTKCDFTGISSWVKRITVMFNGVSTSGTSNPLIQVGTSTGFNTTGYTSASAESATKGIYTTGFGIISGHAGNLLYGHILITNISGNTWTATHTLMFIQGGVYYTVIGSGVISLSAVLDRIRITTVNGTDTFDAGSINIMYEG